MKKIIKSILWISLVVFILMNMVAFFHAYKFTHFTEATIEKTRKPEELSFVEKLWTILFGVDNPRPVNRLKPELMETVEIAVGHSNIEGWYADNDSSKGTFILFHGYGGEKSSLIDRSVILDSLNYNALLIDFMGSGGSDGHTTTIGYKEAEQVKAAYDFVLSKGQSKVYLFGTSMGAVAIMKAVSDYGISPEAIIIECPFGTMYETVAARFSNMNVPAFPMADLLVFWGGIQNGFWAFGHNPVHYAQDINTPTLLLYGEKDKTVSKKETQEIFDNLKGQKVLKTYPLTGHENYLVKNRTDWIKDVSTFLNRH